EQVKGALIRARYCSIKDMDTSSTFLFNIAKKDVQQKMMCHLRHLDGSIASDPAEMRRPRNWVRVNWSKSEGFMMSTKQFHNYQVRSYNGKEME
ncbi:hypothetical protein QTP70_035189, partial [Hemibagrus guttatus]